MTKMMREDVLVAKLTLLYDALVDMVGAEAAEAMFEQIMAEAEAAVRKERQRRRRQTLHS